MAEGETVDIPQEPFESLAQRALRLAGSLAGIQEHYDFQSEISRRSGCNFSCIFLYGFGFCQG